MRIHSALLALSALSFVVLAGCTAEDGSLAVKMTGDVTQEAVESDDPLAGEGVGGTCATTDDCRLGLECGGDGTCATTGDTEEDAPCVLTAECTDGFYCAPFGMCPSPLGDGTEIPCFNVCKPAGEVEEGSSCSSSADCVHGLVCKPLGLGGVCAADGDGDYGDACDSVEDCMAGLVCDGAGSCNVANPLWGFDVYEGQVCPDEEDPGPLRVLFEVPKPNKPLASFYRLPFPNDIRKKGGKLSLDDHPTPGPGFVGMDIAASVIDAMAAEGQYGTNPAVFFRFSSTVDFDTIKASGDDATIKLVNIDPASEDYTATSSLNWSATTGRSTYICDDILQFHPAWERPLAPSTVYAAIVTMGVKGKEDDQPVDLVQDDDFATVLGASAPSDSDLKAAWDAYAPFRAYLTDQGIDPGSIAGAAVFTTGDTLGLMAGFRPVIRAGDPPEVEGLVGCDGQTTSPADDGLEGPEHVRGCFDTDPAFFELQALVAIPTFQEGEAPYLETGGAIATNGGEPVVTGTVDVPVAITIPKGEMPEDGWPLVIYSHGTGGTYRSFITQGLAGELADIALPDDGTHVQVACLGYDGAMHGPRSGSDLPPETLFYNFGNPPAAKGNVYQGAADLLALVYLATTFDLDVLTSPTGEHITFDPANIYFIGHSQGATVGPLFLPFEPDVAGAVLSGAGGGLAISLVSKTSPSDVAGGVALALQEEKVTDSHPIMRLVQQYFDPVDPLNYGVHLFRSPLSEDIPAKSVLQVYGVGDTFTPPKTGRVFAGAMQITVALPLIDDVSGVFEKELPIKGGGYTSVMTQHDPAGAYDGHFVMFQDATALARTMGFIGTLYRDGVPTVFD